MSPLTLAQIGNPPAPWVAQLVLWLFAGVALAALLACAFMAKYFNHWIQAKMTGSGVGIGELVGLVKLVGRVGVAVTPLGPSGTVDFDGRALDGEADGGPIAPGTRVEAVGLRAGRLVVRAAPDRGFDET